MDNREVINIGDWIWADGFGIVEKIHPIYYDIYDAAIYQDEEYKKYWEDLNPEEEKLELGNLYVVIFQVKRFCKYDGTPIKSKKALVCSESYSSTVSPKEYKIIEKAKTKYPKEYASFLKFNKDMTSSIQIGFTVESEEIARSIPKLFREKIAPELSDKFTSDELFEVMERNSCPFKLNNPVVSRYLTNKPIIDLMLFYRIGDFSGKKTMFYGLKVFLPYYLDSDDELKYKLIIPGYPKL